MRSLLAVFLLLPLAAAAEIKNAAQLQASGNSDVIVANVEPVSEEQTAADQPVTMQKLQADVAIHSTEELRSLLEKAEKVANGETQYNTEDPIAVVLHGEEIKAFLRSNYRDNKSLVDLAARLDAFNVIDVKVCQRWMGANGITAGDLPPFLEPVPWGAGERKRLQQAGYGYF
jgi:intracellular sulfur oxidation DsrE/DsrF family protein